MSKEYSPAMQKYLSEYKPEFNAKAYESYKGAYEAINEYSVNYKKSKLDMKDVANVYFKEQGMNARINEDGSIIINGKLADISYNENTKEIAGEPKTPEEKRVEDIYNRAYVETKGRESFPDKADVYIRLSDAIKAADKNPGQKIEVKINGIVLNVEKNKDETYDIYANEAIYPNKNISIIQGKNLTKEEILSAESVEQVKKAVSIGMVMKADKNIHEELEREENKELEGGRTEIEEKREEKLEKKEPEKQVVASTDKDVITEITENKKTQTKYDVIGSNESRSGIGSMDEAKEVANNFSEHEKYINALDGIPVTEGPMKNFEDPLDRGDHSFNPYGEDLVDPYFDDDEPDPYEERTLFAD